MAAMRFWKRSIRSSSASQSSSGQTMVSDGSSLTNFQTWLTKVGIKPMRRIYPGSSWENGYNVALQPLHPAQGGSQC